MFKFVRSFITLICFSTFLASPIQAQENNTSSIEKKEINISLIAQDIQKIENSISKTVPSKIQSVEIVKQLN